MRLLALLVLLTLSGGCALVYQTLWMQELRLIIGGTTAAVSCVTAIFMGGLGLGNILLGARADRTANPLRLYALLELLIAASAICIPFLLWGVRELYLQLGGQAALGSTLGTLVRLLLATLILGFPATCMGGTLPAAMRFMTSAEDHRRRSVALMYAANTCGAVAGVLFSTLFLIEVWGLRGTLVIVASINLLIGFVAYAWSLRSRPEESVVGAIEPASSDAEQMVPAGGEAAVMALSDLCLIAAVVGTIFFGMELVWFRMLAPLLGGSTFTYGLILSMVLAGIGAGSFAYAPLMAWLRPAPRLLMLTCALEGLALLFPYWLGDAIASWTMKLRLNWGSSFAGMTAGWVCIAALVVVPAAFVSGLQFPLIVALAGDGRNKLGQQTGWIFGANTFGAILGSLVGGFWLLPGLGVTESWIGLALTVTLLGAYVLIRQSPRWQDWLAWSALMALFVLLASGEGPTAAWRHSGIGAGRAAVSDLNDPNAWMDWRNHQNRAVVWSEDGVESSIAVRRGADGLNFYANGKSDGSAVGDAGTQIMLSLVPAALHAHPETALVVGLGSGQSAGWLASVPECRHVDVVEIEPILKRVAEDCRTVNQDVLNNPKMRLWINDAREHLLVSQNRYDLIVSEPSNPYRAGVATLFTHEFYEAVLRRLNDDGLFVQWLQCYEIDDETFATVLKTLRQTFNHVEIWTGESSDLFLLCHEAPLAIDTPALERKLSSEPYRSGMRYGWNTRGVEGFVGHYFGGTKTVDDRIGQGDYPINLDHHNRIEFGFARSVGRADVSPDLAVLRRRALELGDHRPVVSSTVAPDWALVDDEWHYWHHQMTAVVPDADREMRLKALAAFETDIEQTLPLWRKQPRPPTLPFELQRIAQAAVFVNDSEAKALLAQLKEVDPIGARILRAQAEFQRRDYDQATRLLRDAFLQLRSSPLVAETIVTDGFTMIGLICDQAPQSAASFFNALSEPFCVDVFHHQRLTNRLNLAVKYAPAETPAILRSFEPAVPWQQQFLQLRAESYRQFRDPLLPKALADLELFLANER